jgi:hypothetical protein
MSVPNKPMVPTAPTSLATYSRRSRRRHIGQPFGSCDERGGFVFDEITARA